MEANNNSKHGKAYSVAEEDATTTNNMMMKQKHLSDDEAAAGEPENYRGWKAMPYVIGQCSISLIYISALLLMLRAHLLSFLIVCTSSAPSSIINHRHVLFIYLLVDDDRCP